MKNLKIFFALILLFLTFASCAGVKQTPAQSRTKERIEYRDRHFRDTVYVRDSIMIQKLSDTVYISKYHIRYKERLRTDTSWVYVTDTIRMTQVVEVEKKLSRLDSLRMSLGGVFLWLLLALVLIGIGWVLKRFL